MYDSFHITRVSSRPKDIINKNIMDIPGGIYLMPQQKADVLQILFSLGRWQLKKYVICQNLQ